MFWRAFQNVFNDDFKEAIDLLIANKRTAPMHEDLGKAYEEAKNRRLQSDVRGRGYGAVIQNAAHYTKADPEVVKLSVQLLRDKWSGELNHDQFLEGCKLLDEVATRHSP